MKLLSNSLQHISAICLALAVTAAPTVASGTGKSTLSPTASEASPLAQQVVELSNQGLTEKLVYTGGMAWTESLEHQVLAQKVEIPEIPDVSTTGLLCQLLTLQPAQGCLETQLSGCTTQSWCTSETWDNCTNGDWCTIAAICTNTKGCTDAGTCTSENGCTGTSHCTSGSGCTQNDSCTNGANCTNDHELCTGGSTCTKGTGCTAGNNCTGSTGCTKDAQCTKGDVCTKGSQCTTGKACTNGVNCPKKSPGAAPVVEVASLFTGASLDDILQAQGAFDPRAEPHFQPRTYHAGLGLFGLLLVPGLLRRRRS